MQFAQDDPDYDDDDTGGVPEEVGCGALVFLIVFLYTALTTFGAR